jgi:hypothetical protein
MRERENSLVKSSSVETKKLFSELLISHRAREKERERRKMMKKKGTFALDAPSEIIFSIWKKLFFLCVENSLKSESEVYSQKKERDA